MSDAGSSDTAGDGVQVKEGNDVEEEEEEDESGDEEEAFPNMKSVRYPKVRRKDVNDVTLTGRALQSSMKTEQKHKVRKLGLNISPG